MFFEPKYGMIKINHVAHVFNMTKFGHTFRPEEWRHICYSAEQSKQSPHLVVVMDGKVYLNKSCDSGASSYPKMTDHFCKGNFNKTKTKAKKMIGSITDVHIWNRTLAIPDMKDFTQPMIIIASTWRSVPLYGGCSSPCIPQQGKLCTVVC